MEDDSDVLRLNVVPRRGLMQVIPCNLMETHLCCERLQTPLQHTARSILRQLTKILLNARELPLWLEPAVGVS
eukprot:CAMPEP_0194529054 /NCGR_PEP_ID=MMETSP0253-20130528/65611_1 /TAXON_ID=2966 /ORGANISM="Noctiluca scintillans" /LENGTH=72 /DNA_ID=CAMNT_0039374159 /DNA_START=448 /DNA_END=662 /DNA_ORIENTATION=-